MTVVILYEISWKSSKLVLLTGEWMVLDQDFSMPSVFTTACLASPPWVLCLLFCFNHLIVLDFLEGERVPLYELLL